MIKKANHSYAYLILAALVSIVMILEFTQFNFLGKFENGTYDLSMKHRYFKPIADPDIVIIDIDEGTLEAMSEEFGRWPWPREVFAEFIENLSEQKPAAVVFDIIFSEPDIRNTDSDAYFNEVIGNNNNLYFPILRLPEKNDSLSEIRPSMIPGLIRVENKPTQDKPFAVLLPFLSEALKSGRMGTNSIYTDDDGKARLYTLFHHHDGWNIPSLPLKISLDLGFKAPEKRELLINWRGGKGTYTNVRFSDVYFDFLSQKKKRKKNEFEGKILVIGSTAPGLFDYHATPLDNLHPGVEILATTIDNAIHNDFIHVPESDLLAIIVGLLVIWITAFAFIQNVKEHLIDGVYGASQAILMFISYSSINLSHTYIDLSAPILFGFGAFLLSRTYLIYSRKLDIKHIWDQRFITPGILSIGVVRITDDKTGKIINSSLPKAIKKGLKKENVFIEKLQIEKAGIRCTFGHIYFIYSLLDQEGSHFSSDELNKILMSFFSRKKLQPHYLSATNEIEFSKNKVENQTLWRKTITDELNSVYRRNND